MRRILEPGRNCMGVYEVGASGMLIDLDDYFRALYHAAMKAREYILFVGWRFDSRVRLLRVPEEEDAVCPVALLDLLKCLCDRNPRLRVLIIAWDYNLFLAPDREWFLAWKFNRACGDRIRFLQDKIHPFAASHHMKFAVIDGTVGFVGGIDLSARHWDDSCHAPDNRYRVDSKGKPYEANHDLQTRISGPAVLELVKFFTERWRLSTGEELELPPCEEYTLDVRPALSLPAPTVALSRTIARTIFPLRDSVEEVRALYLDAIAAADSLIYIENQYFSSQAVYKALTNRMKDKERPRLQIVIVLPGKMHAYFEEISIGITQMRMTRSLRKVAEERGHSLGIYWTGAPGTEDIGKQTYIHSKLLLVDDRFLSVGSANTTNRSMGLDTELNVSWEADPEEDARLVRSIRKIRVRLLAEHAGVRRAVDCRELYRIPGLVDRLYRLTDSSDHRLRRYQPDLALGKSSWLRKIGAHDLILDPETPIIEENVYEHIARNRTGLLNRTILLLHELIWGKRPK